MSKGKCTIEGCENAAKAKGLCPKHYMRKWTHGDANTHFPNKKSGKPCTIEGCGRPITATGLCAVHYARKFRHGSTDSLLPNYGSHRIVHKQGYIRIWTGERYEMEHVLIVEKALGHALPDGAVVHHVNGNPGDNRPENLVVCPSQTYHFLLHKRQDLLEELGYITHEPEYLEQIKDTVL